MMQITGYTDRKKKETKTQITDITLTKKQRGKDANRRQRISF